jgi:hypothetical protein
MVRWRTRPWFALLAVAYLVLMGALLFVLKSPWNYALAGFVLFKGSIFMTVVGRANSIGRDAPRLVSVVKMDEAVQGVEGAVGE